MKVFELWVGVIGEIWIENSEAEISSIRSNNHRLSIGITSAVYGLGFKQPTIFNEVNEETSENYEKLTSLLVFVKVEPDLLISNYLFA